MQDRIHYLDWLRVLVVLGITQFHVSMIFVTFPWWISNDQQNLVPQTVMLVLNQFQMPLLFLVAGVAVWFSLGRRTGVEYLIERVKRLLVPVIFGMLVLMPWNHFLAAVHYQGPEGFDSTFFQFYPNYLQTNVVPFLQDKFEPGGLWFLWYLLFYSLALLPLFLFARRWSGRRFLSWLALFLGKRGAVFLLVIPLVLVQISGAPSLLKNMPIFYYVIFFVYGFLLYSDPRSRRGIEKSGPIALVCGAITMTVYLLLLLPSGGEAPLGAIYWPMLRDNRGLFGLYLVLQSFNSWFWVIGLLYLGQKFLNFSNRFLRYAHQAVLPFYILNETIVAAIGFYVVQWNMDALPKFLIISISMLVIILALYDLVIKRTNITRFLFGMRLKPKERLATSGKNEAGT